MSDPRFTDPVDAPSYRRDNFDNPPYVAPRDDNGAMWGVIAVLALLIIGGLVYYAGGSSTTSTATMPPPSTTGAAPRPEPRPVPPMPPAPTTPRTTQ